MKQLGLFVQMLFIIKMILCLNTGATGTIENSLLVSKYKQPSSELGRNLPLSNSYYEGWVHYYHYNNGTTIGRPRLFFKNNDYYAQRIHISKVKDKDKYGSFMIPSKSHFYLVVNRESIQIFTSRSEAIKKQFDSFYIKFINPIPEDNYRKGGIHDLGSFAIGHCFEIKGKFPNGRDPSDERTENNTWIFCLDNKKEKAKLLKVLIKLKLQQQRKFGEFKTEDTIKSENKEKTFSNLISTAANNPDESRKENGGGEPLDGYWILLQDWSECTLKCGSGESFQQWQCIPPKNGGKPCEGKSIKVKKCNTHPCPSYSSILSMAKLSSPEVKKPIIKVAKFSSRLQRYTKCVIKENDAYLTSYDLKTNAESKLPIRIVMNNMTASIFKDDEYQDIYHSFELEKTDFIKLSNHFCCFNLRDSIKSAILCGYEKFCGNSYNNKWVTEWSKHFQLFKVGCRVGKMETLLSPDDETQLADELRKKLGQAKMDINKKKEKFIKQQMLVNSNNNYKLKVMKTQNLGLKAIQKELQLENLIKNEEKQKEEQEIASLLKKIQEEKEKEACLKTTIQARDLDAEIINERRAAENEVKEIQVEVLKQVELKRIKMKKMIEMMRAKARLRKSALEAELNSLRNKMAEEMLKAGKNGDLQKCKRGKIDNDFRDSYCDTIYIDDFVTNGDCKTDENFCYMCCESEFGNMHIDRRESCYNMCDLKENKIVQISQQGNGPYVWKSNLY